VSVATVKTLAYLRQQGYHAWVVEKFAAGIRFDAFGFMDILAYKADSPIILAVQSTVGGKHAEHVKKYSFNPILRKRIADWTKHHKFQIISWRKAGDRGKRKLWTPRVEDVTEQTFVKGETDDRQVHV
jgi:hypothetical protein